VGSRFSKGSSRKSENIKEEDESPASHNTSTNNHKSKHSLLKSQSESSGASLRKKKGVGNSQHMLFPEANGLFKVPEESELLKRKFSNTPSSIPIRVG